MENLEKHLDDFEFLKDVKYFVIDILQNDKGKDLMTEPENAIFEHLADDRLIRIIFPHGKEILEPYLNGKPLFFVGFVGNRCPEAKTELKEEVWRIDSTLAKELKQHPNIIGYFTAERTKDGEWGNLVLFKSELGVTEWRNSDTHSIAVNELSPKFYTNVRIHGGQLSSGIKGDFDIERTLSLEYSNNVLTNRVLRRWKEKDNKCEDQ